MADDSTKLDVLVVGAGFSGIYQLYHYRKLGYSVGVFEAGSELGGTWLWNCYPGARVDTDTPIYQLSLPELYQDWTWKERYPGWQELREYFQYVDRKLDVKKDVTFNTTVVSARFDTEVDRWIVTTKDGRVVHPRFLVLCVGFSSKTYTPEFKGLEKFQGIWHHTAKWPEKGLDVKDKRVGVIGTGASGVQVIQEVAPEVAHLTVFQRTPNFALPMHQRLLDAESQARDKALYPVLFRRCRQTGGGFNYDRYPKNWSDATPEERILHWEDLWTQGGFHIPISNFYDFLMSQDANDEVYKFWRDKVRARIHDPVMQEKLAPEVAPHPFGAKRASLEQTYYEVFNQSNVTLVDVTNECEISEVTEKGVLTSDGVAHELDILVLATGFDSMTGGITQIDIRGVDGVPIAEKWAKGVWSNLGMTATNFPNLFWSYGPQGPTAFGNGPTILEIQGEWIINCIKHLMENQLTAIYSTPQAEADWRAQVMDLGTRGLITKAKSWYMGANIPGKPIEPLNYAGGVQNYLKIISEVAEKGYEGFTLSKCTSHA